MAVRTQFSVFLQNKPGELAKLAKALARGKVNIEAVGVAETADTGVVRLLVDQVEKGRKVLKRGKFATGEHRVIAVQAKNVPGALAKLADRLAKAKVNILYTYGSAGGGAEGIIVFGVSDVKKASGVLKLVR